MSAPEDHNTGSGVMPKIRPPPHTPDSHTRHTTRNPAGHTGLISIRPFVIIPLCHQLGTRTFSIVDFHQIVHVERTFTAGPLKTVRREDGVRLAHSGGRARDTAAQLRRFRAPDIRDDRLRQRARRVADHRAVLPRRKRFLRALRRVHRRPGFGTQTMLPTTPASTWLCSSGAPAEATQRTQTFHLILICSRHTDCRHTDVPSSSGAEALPSQHLCQHGFVLPGPRRRQPDGHRKLRQGLRTRRVLERKDAIAQTSA